ncbi:MAG: acyltransferase family protein [bacterium]|nr:acyltransferase family protein [bacterium]
MSDREPVNRWGRSPQRSGALLSVFRAAYKNWFRMEWEGLENIPKSGGALLVANHAGMMPVDGGLVMVGVEEELGRHVYGLAHRGFFRYPFVSTLLQQSGAVVAHPDNAHRLLCEDKELVMVFPEGDKGPVKLPSERYKMQRFGRGGFVATAIRAGVPIIPIALMGTEDTTPVVTVLPSPNGDFPVTVNALLFGPVLGAFAPFPAKIRGRVLPPVQWDDPPDLEHYSRSLMMDRAEEIRASMQEALDEMLEARESVWTG